MKPFTCPHCGAHDYVVILTGCAITGGILEEAFSWDPATGDYISGGSVLVDSESLENETGRAICSNCDKDVSAAVQAYEAGTDSGVAQA